MPLKSDQECRFFSQCGGCDFLDLSSQDYQTLKKERLSQSLSGLWVPDIDYQFIGSKSRRRITLQVNNKNQVGFFAKKSRNLVEIDDCFVAEQTLSDFIAPLKQFIKSQPSGLFSKVMLTLFDNVLDVVLVAKKDLDFLQCQKATAFAQKHQLNISYQVKGINTPIYLSCNNQIIYPNCKIDLTSQVFIQATSKGLDNIVTVIKGTLNQVDTVNKVADIYAGFGAYSFAIVDKVDVTAFEGSEEMVQLINKNAAKNDLAHKIRAVQKDLYQDCLTKKELEKFDAIIINPPRNGATPQIKEIAKSIVKHVIYVSCNPKTFAFDAKILLDASFEMISLTALDQFHGSQHMEVVAVLRKK